MLHLHKLQPLFWTALLSLIAASPAADANPASPPQTGEIVLHFTQRSPLSSRTELSRRLSRKDLGPDYDLTAYTFRAYVPTNYDPSTPYGVLVMLGNHDVASVCTKWEPLFNKSHMIYITVDWHSTMSSIDLIGLGFDAIDNLKRLYTIDTHRLYDMWFNSGSLEMCLAGTDVYSGMIIGENWDYFRQIQMPNHMHHLQDFLSPPLQLRNRAKPQGIVLISIGPNPDGGADVMSKGLKEDGFTHVLSITETSAQVHYPYVASWITDPVLPFLDKAAQDIAEGSDADNTTPAGPTPLAGTPAPQTGEIMLNFTQRSPLSSRKEIARRLSCKESDLGNDYDLTAYPFSVYVPLNYDPSTPYGVFVYLGDGHANTVDILWEPLFDKSHMIFITPLWPNPNQANWQLVGLGFDAIDNLKRHYNIDTHRLYQMWLNTGSLGMSLAGADVYTGMIFNGTNSYFRNIEVNDNKSYYPAAFKPPPLDLLRKAKSQGIVMIGVAENPDPACKAIVSAMKQDGFNHVLSITSAMEDLDYPNLGLNWMTDPVLPFLDKSAKEIADTPANSNQPAPAPAPPADAVPTANPGAPANTTTANAPTLPPDTTSPAAPAVPTTAPSSATPPQTGEIELHFTQRSPLSSRKEIARRLSCKESDLRHDYDLTTVTFRAYVPTNYDPSQPYGVFVFLGNHDVNGLATKWEPLFDKSHMIFITLDWHSHMGAEWQLVGMGFDAIDNLKRLYTIDTHRLYDMWIDSGSLEMSLAGADVYTGMIVGLDWDYFRQINLPDRSYLPAKFPPPPMDQLRRARPQGVVLISMAPNPGLGPPLISTALKQDGFTHVLSISESHEDLRYPYYPASWITDPVLPFLDKAAQEIAEGPDNSDKPAAAPADTTDAAPTTPADSTVVAAPTTRPSDSSPAASADAQHLLSMAQLDIDNGATELARTKLQTIVTSYPNDPAAVPAQKLLDSLPPPPPPPQ